MVLMLPFTIISTKNINQKKIKNNGPNKKKRNSRNIKVIDMNNIEQPN